MEKPINYFVAIALIEKGNKLAMPLGGKIIKATNYSQTELEEIGKEVALELLLRVMQASELNPLRRMAKERSLLLVEINMSSMQEKLPSIKSQWLKDGDIDSLVLSLKMIAENIWSMDFLKYEGIILKKL